MGTEVHDSRHLRQVLQQSGADFHQDSPLRGWDATWPQGEGFAFTDTAMNSSNLTHAVSKMSRHEGKFTPEDRAENKLMRFSSSFTII